MTTKHLASKPEPLLSRPMKRLAFSICIAIAAMTIGACEKHPAAELPEHYQHKGAAKHSDSGHENKTPAHDAKEKTPNADHKG